MVEKRYGGVDSTGRKGIILKKEKSVIREKKIRVTEEKEKEKMKNKDLLGEGELEGEQQYRKAGRIAAEILSLARRIVKAETPILEIVEELEEEILKRGGQPAFPIDVSCNEIAAHYSPGHDDKSIARGLVKVDIGVALEGYAVDTAVSIDLSPEGKYVELINASNEALKDAIKVAAYNVEVCEIGKAIHAKITSLGFSPIRNLSGHEINRWKIHAGLTIPNYDNGNIVKLQEGVYAIEPFSTTGTGIVQEGGVSSVYMLKEKKPIRDRTSRDILEFIEHQYRTFPFSSRWLVKKFGIRSLIALNFLEREGCLHRFRHLVEKSRAVVSQAEHTLLIKKNKKEVLTLTY